MSEEPSPSTDPSPHPQLSKLQRVRGVFVSRFRNLKLPPLSSLPSLPKIQVSQLREIKFKEMSLKAREWIRHELNQETLKRRIQEFDPQKTLDWFSKRFQKRGVSSYGTLITVVLSTYFLASLTALLVEDFLPDPVPASRSSKLTRAGKIRSIYDYNPIFLRNLFSSTGTIPGEGGDTNSATPNDLGGAPVRSALPLNLVGVMVMSNELLSIATIEDKSASIIYPARVQDEIPSKARILKIEPNRVVFVNTASGRREYIELPEDAQQAPKIASTSSGPSIDKVAPNQFNVARTEVDKALADFNNILTQARAIPNFDASGAPNGYKLLQIVPGSIYDKLGLQNGDIITGLNGEPISDPGKAFEMISELKKSNHLELQVKKDGKQSTYTYDIR